ncbi:MAG: Endonuclease/exonuclease/phosphatase [Frankiales bacterium]|nr:Endonuclease/exonuclease/phosphatase [Frankiales bacterium]
MRVVCWNVRSLRDDARGVAAFLRAQDPDVVLIQEAPRLLLWRWSCARLARRSGLRRVVGGAPAAGNLLLVSDRVRVVHACAVRLPKRPGLHRRGAVTARLEVGGRSLTVLGTHLDLDPVARLDSVRRLRALHLPGPLLVAADVNEPAGGPAWQALSAGLVDAGAECGPTFPRHAPTRRIDGVFVDPASSVLAVRRPDPGPVTDHLPLVLDLA